VDILGESAALILIPEDGMFRHASFHVPCSFSTGHWIFYVKRISFSVRRRDQIDEY
jgi:hypothetical protein